jgi:hypothetical protein
VGQPKSVGSEAFLDGSPRVAIGVRHLQGKADFLAFLKGKRAARTPKTIETEALFS